MTRERKIEISTTPRGTNRGAAGFIDAARFAGGRTRRFKKPAPGRPDVLSQPKLLRRRLRDKCRIRRPASAEPNTRTYTSTQIGFVFSFSPVEPSASPHARPNPHDGI